MMTQADIDNAPPRLLLAYVRGLLGLVHAGRFADTIEAFALAGLPIDEKLKEIEPVFQRADDLLIDRDVKDGRYIEDAAQARAAADDAMVWYEEIEWMQKIGARARVEGADQLAIALTAARERGGNPQSTLGGLRTLLTLLPTLDAKAFAVTPDVLARGRAIVHRLFKEPTDRNNVRHDRIYDTQELDDLLQVLRDFLGELRDRHELAKRRRNGKPIPGFDVGILASMRPDAEAGAPEIVPPSARAILPGGLDGEEDE